MALSPIAVEKSACDHGAEAGMYLDIDIGNSRVKWRLGSGAEIRRGACASSPQVVRSAMQALLGEPSGHSAQISAVRVSSVKDDEYSAMLTAFFREQYSLDVQFARSQHTTIGICNSYAKPEKMGVDRWSAVIAAVDDNRRSKSPKRLVVVVDAGSALTLDLVTENGREGEHLGGYIVPGFYMQVNSLLGGTQRISVDASQENPTINPGCDTSTAVMSGILASLVALIQTTVATHQVTHGMPAVLYLTGGDSELLKPHLAQPVVCKPELVLDGIGLLLS